jgi:protein transport protein SEC24
MADMYRNCELDTIVSFTAKQSIARLMENNPKTVKEAMVANCAQILSCYRKNCASPSSAGQLILPECMKLLPLYTNCLLKSDALSGGADVGCDDRAFLMNTISSMDIGATVAFFYPRLLPLHDISTAEEHITELPNSVRCTIEKINENGVYLLDNGIYLFLYVGLAADPNFVQEVFGVATAAQINIDMPQLEERENPLSKKVRKVVEIVRGERTRQYMRLVIVRQRDKLDILFRHYLCEDRAGQGTSGSGSESNFSYVDFLCHMHKEIRALLG